MTDVEQIEAAVLEARLPMQGVLKKAGVSSGTLWAARKFERPMRPLTKARLLDAIEALKGEGK